jgi:arylsulfatase A-like enzyme
MGPVHSERGPYLLAIALFLSACRGGPRDGIDLLARLDEAAVRTDSLDLAFLGPRWSWHQHGWAEPEKNAKGPVYWMRKHEASIDAPFFSASTKDLVLQVRCHPRLDPGVPVAVTLNDSDVGAFTATPALSVAHVTLPGASQRPGINRLRFSVPRRYEPAAGDTDGRPLAIAVHSLEIRPRQGPRSPTPSVVRGGELVVPPNASVGFSWPGIGPSSVRLEVAEGAGRKTRLEVELASDERLLPLASHALRPGGRLRRALTLPEGMGPFVEMRLANAGPGTIRVRELRLLLPPPGEGARGASLGGTPNIILFLVDTLRSDDLGAYGSGLPTSPEFDRFAREAMLFAEASAQSAWTRPTVASLFTGLHAGTHGMSQATASLGPEITTLAEALLERGYATVAFVANGVVSPDRGFAQGFAVWNPQGSLHDAPSDVLAREALASLDGIREPFFLYVHTLDPHDPYEPSDADWEPFRPKSYQGLRDPRQLLAKGRLDDAELAYLHSKYRGEIRHNDGAFGALVAGLRARGLLDRSVVVFTSDHGEEFLEHGGLRHRRTLYDEIVRVPLAVRLPGSRGAGRVVDTPFRQVDLFPTLAALVGAKTPKEVEGLDHSGAWLAPSVTSPVADAMSELVDDKVQKFAVRSGDLKLIVNADGRGYWRTDEEVELYDLRADPRERHNMVYERPIAAHYLRNLLGRLQVEQEGRRQKAAPKPLTTDERQELRALGYVQ